MKSLLKRGAIVSALCLVIPAGTAQALTIFHGADSGALSTDPHPNSDAAAAAFNAAASALGALDVIDFENLATTGALVVNPAPGVTLTFGNSDPLYDTITNADFGLCCGYNTTAGGSNYALVAEDDLAIDTTAVFDFAVPIQAFGAYLTGVADIPGTVQVTFDDGSLQVFTVPGNPGVGGVEFWGFVDPGKAIHSVAISSGAPPNSNDALGIDDVHFVPIPEPAAALLFGVGSALAGVAIRRYSRR